MIAAIKMPRAQARHPVLQLLGGGRADEALLSPGSHVIVRGNGSPWKAARNGRLGPANPLASPPGAITALHGYCVTIRLEAVAFCVPLPETGPLVAVHSRNRLRLARRGDRRSNGGAAENYCCDGESRQGALCRRAARRLCFCSDAGCTSSSCQPHCPVLPPAGRTVEPSIPTARHVVVVSGQIRPPCPLNLGRYQQVVPRGTLQHEENSWSCPKRLIVAHPQEPLRGAVQLHRGCLVDIPAPRDLGVVAGRWSHQYFHSSTIQSCHLVLYAPSRTARHSTPKPRDDAIAAWYWQANLELYVE